MLEKSWFCVRQRAASWLLMIGIAVVAVTSIALVDKSQAAAVGGEGVSAPKAFKQSAKVATRTRQDMILEVEMKALREALDSKQDQERTASFSGKADKEAEDAKASATDARAMVQKASTLQGDAQSAKDAATAAVAKAEAAATEARTMSDNAKKDAKLAGVDSATYAEMYKEAQAEIIKAREREDSALKMLKEAQGQEEYFRSMVRRRIKNAEDFYYIAEAAMKKGGNSQALEFAIKAKAEMQQAQVAENEANIRADATKAAEKVVDSRKQSTEAAKVKAVALAQLKKLSDEIGKALNEAFVAANASAIAAEKILASVKNFATSKDEILAFTGKKLESITAIKDSAEKKETLAISAAEAAKAVVEAKQKALAEAESKAQSALDDAKTVVITPQPGAPNAAPAGAQTAPAAPAAKPAPAAAAAK